MTLAVTRIASPRWGFSVKTVPTRKLSRHGDSYTPYSAADYAQILDTVYEMADQVANSNGISHERAIEQVIRAEEFCILPSDVKRIVAKLNAP